MTTDKPVVWMAGPDRVAHAQARGLARTLCGRPVVEARWAWPAEASCPDCCVRAGVLVPVVAP